MKINTTVLKGLERILDFHYGRNFFKEKIESKNFVDFEGVLKVRFYQIVYLINFFDRKILVKILESIGANVFI